MASKREAAGSTILENLSSTRMTTKSAEQLRTRYWYRLASLSQPELYGCCMTGFQSLYDVPVEEAEPPEPGPEFEGLSLEA